MPPGIQANVPLFPYTTFYVGGSADYVVEAHKREDIVAACNFATKHGKPLRVLGGGSNVLISDAGYKGVIVLMRTKGVTVEKEAPEEILVRVEAGEVWDDVVLDTVLRGWSGLENLSGIPGTVGAAPIQNINAYGASVGDVIHEVEVLDQTTLTKKSLDQTACQFGYRDSIFKKPAGAALIVLAVTFRLQPQPGANLSYHSASQSIKRLLDVKGIQTPTALAVREVVLEARRTIGMLEGQYRSAGSFFKNTIVSKDQFAHIKEIVTGNFPALGEKLAPWYWELPDGTVKVSTAFLLECSPYNKRLYGTTDANARVHLSPKHSLSIVTEVGATASDVLLLAETIITAVEEIFSITIEPEVDYVT